VSKRTKGKVEESRSGLMGLCMKDTGEMTRQMVRGDLFIQMGTFTRVIGFQIRLRAMEYTLIWMVLSTRDSGKKTSSMVKVKKPGQMERCTRVTTSMARSMALVILCGATVQSTKASFTIIILRVTESIAGLMEGHSKASGRITKCMGEVSSLGLMAGSTKESTLKIRNKVKVPSIGQMAGDMLVLGQMESSTEREPL
jgi:hypothetical protein